VTQTRPEASSEARRHPQHPPPAGYAQAPGQARPNPRGRPAQAPAGQAPAAWEQDQRQWAREYHWDGPGTGEVVTPDPGYAGYAGYTGGQPGWPAQSRSGPTTWAPESSWSAAQDEEDYAGPPPRHLLRARPRQRASWREDLVTGFCGAILGLGLVVEGWSALNLPPTTQFLSPWHIVLGVGFLATAAWIATRHQVRRAWSLAAVPPGYGLGLVGIAIALLALGGDAAWHAAVGTGSGVVRITEPFRLMLFLGAGLLVTSGYRAAWAGPSPARGLSLRAFTPILLPMIMATTLVSFSFQFASPYVAWRRPGFEQFAINTPEWTVVAIAALFTVLVTNLVFLAPMLLTLRRWQPPFGAVTITFGAVGVLNSLLTEMALAGVVAAALAGGLAADLVVNRWPPGPDHPGHLRLVAVAAPLAYWLAYFAVLAAGYHQSWHPSLWLGALVMAVLSGYVLAVLMQPTPIPATAWAEADRPEEGAGRRR